MANVWPATQSQLYGELNKLAADGLIEVAEIGPRGRKEYEVTDAGRAELVRWVTNPQEDPPYRSAPLLRVFLLGELPPDQAREYVATFAQHADAEFARLEQLREELAPWGDGDAEFYGGAALEYGLQAASMKGDWARSVVRSLDERKKS